jgi:predicted ribosome quality control (RQC) complex YloA/Tae2 family protein
MSEESNVNDGIGEQANLLAEAPRRKLLAAIRKAERLLKNLDSDIEKHGDADRWRKYGELLLANLSTAVRDGDIVIVKDLYSENEPEIQIEGESRYTLNEIADHYFKRYAKARNAAGIIAERLANANSGLKNLRSQLSAIDDAIINNDLEFLLSLTEKPKSVRQQSKKAKQEQSYKGVRRFVSSDGFEIWVGKKAADNDYLTFRMARSLETWLHTADYPGSHVVIRDSGKKTVPEQTLVEAAQLAAFYSNAREHGKVSVRYTQRKFVHKPKKAPPGMVSLSSFKSVLVEPGVNVKLRE